MAPVAPTRMEKYESDVTVFLRDFLAKHPEVVDKQRAARATWWDRPYDAEARAAAAESKVPKKPYEYYSTPR
jgi:hypothetical protein